MRKKHPGWLTLLTRKRVPNASSEYCASSLIGQGRRSVSVMVGRDGALHPPTESVFAFGSTSSTPPQGGSGDAYPQ